MDTLMRILKTWLLVLLFIVGIAPLADAQSALGMPAVQAERFFFDLSWVGQPRDQSFTTSSTFSIYNEQGAVAGAQSIGGGTLFDVGAGVNLWRAFGVGIAYSTVTNHNDATVSVRVPHPLIFGQPREATTTVSDLGHSENVVHLQFRWTVPVTSKIQVALMLGPSFFTVRQDIATVVAPRDISDPPPHNSVTITNVTVTEVKDSPAGFNIGLDGTYSVTRLYGVNIGVGGFLRYSQASLDLPAPEGLTIDANDLKAGGGQAALGLRLRF
jgi:hypothetical protein